MRKALMLVVSTLALGGCMGYSNYPAVGGAVAANENPNNSQVDKVVTAALQYVTTRYPAPGDGQAAINLPPGTRRWYYERIAANGGKNLTPMTPEIASDKTIPIYHVGRVWVRTQQSTVDILRPMPELGAAPDGTPVYQAITVTLEGGFQPWRVVNARSWEPGVVPVPELYFMPETDNPNQFRVWQNAHRVAGK